MKNNTEQEWHILGIEAEKHIHNGNIELAKNLLIKSIELSPSEPWPYLLLSSIVESSDDAINLINESKKIAITEWYYINLIEKYKIRIEELKKEFLEKYNKNNLIEESTIAYWRQLRGLSNLQEKDIDISDISPIINSWDCIALLCTGKEFENDFYLKFLSNLDSTIDINISKKINFKLVIKTKDIDKYIIPKFLDAKFNSLEILAIEIPDELDIYDDKNEKSLDKEAINKYGSKCGPNFIFFETIKRLSEYNSTLLLECDCLLFDNWMQRIDKYVESQSFLISGSQSDSPNNEKYYDERNQHINGGTAIYATGNILFQKFINLCEKMWPIYIKYNSIHLPYDYILLLTIESYFNESKTQNDKIIWSYIKKNYITNSIIFNWSDTTYEKYDPLDIRNMFNPAILHQKPNQYTGVFCTTDILEFYNTHKVDENFDEVSYQKKNPIVKDFYQPNCKNNGIDDKHRLYYHWCIYGNPNKNFIKDMEICIKVNNGLANRLRTLNSFFNFAKTIGSKKLKVCWAPGSGWSDDHFLDLFEPLSNYIEFISIDDYEEIKLSGKYLVLDKLVFKNQEDIREYIYVEPKKEILNWIQSSSFCYDGDSCIEYMFDNIDIRYKIYDKLNLKREIKKEFDEIIDIIPNIDHCIGLHIRRGDALTHPFCNLYALSSDNCFEEIIEKNPHINFFLSTDCRQTQQHFIDKYKNRIFYNSKKIFISSDNYLLKKYNQKDAVLDLFLLSKTTKIFGTNFSSFSNIAGLIGNVEVETALIKQEKNKNRTSNTIKINCQKNWQFPAHTEKQAWINHTNKEFEPSKYKYIAFPWASLIDSLTQKYGTNFHDWNFQDNNFYLEKNKNYYTVCQHIHWKGLMSLWEQLGIHNICISHLTESIFEEYQRKHPKIKLHPWHLIAPNAENGWLQSNLIIKPLKNKKYIASFIGAHNRYYPTDIRLQLQELCKSHSNVVFELNNSWFFNSIVYDYQMKNKAFDMSGMIEKSSRYNEILSDSVFSLCPEGTGPNTLRLWESMSVGSIPVLFENDWIKPELGDYNWDDVSVTIPKNQIANTFEILNGIDNNRIETMQINCINAYNYTRNKTCF